MSDLTHEEWDRDIAINLKTQFNCIKAVLPAMLAAGHGRFVDMASVTGPLVSNPGWLPTAHPKVASPG